MTTEGDARMRAIIQHAHITAARRAQFDPTAIRALAERLLKEIPPDPPVIIAIRRAVLTNTEITNTPTQRKGVTQWAS